MRHMLFRIDHIKYPQFQFKVDKITQQLYLKRVCFIHESLLNMSDMIIAESAKLHF